MPEEYRALSGWDVATGLQTRRKLESLGLSEVADWLGKAGLMRGLNRVTDPQM